MSESKKFTPQEAAILVLKKAEELYKSSSLAKGDWAKIHSKLKREGYSEKSADKIDGAIKAKMNKSDAEGNNPDAAADAKLGEQVEQDVHQHEERNADPAHAEPQMKGHIKLAKFMGRMEHKKSLAKSGPMSEPIGKPIAGKDMKAGNPNKELMGMSDIGASVRGEGGSPNMTRAKKEASISLSHEKSMPKPKLPG